MRIRSDVPDAYFICRFVFSPYTLPKFIYLYKLLSKVKLFFDNLYKIFLIFLLPYYLISLLNKEILKNIIS